MKRRNLLKNLALGIATAVTGLVAYTHRGPKAEIGGTSGGTHRYYGFTSDGKMNYGLGPMHRKFLVGHRVRIIDDERIDAGREAIISNGHLFHDGWGYSLVILNNGIPCDFSAWHSENNLTLIDDDCNTGCAIHAWYDEHY